MPETKKWKVVTHKESFTESFKESFRGCMGYPFLIIILFFLLFYFLEKETN